MRKNMHDIFQSAIESHKSGRLQDAEQLYKSVLAKEPKHSDANHNLGVLLVSVGYLSNALSHFRAALDQDPTVNQFWLSYIDALIKVGSFEMASEAICDGRQAGVPDESLSALTLALDSASSGNTLLEKHKSSLAEKNKRPSYAKKNKMKKGKRASPRDKPSQKEMNRLMELFQQGRFDLLETAAASMTKKFPTFQVGWKCLGVALIKLGRFHESIDALQRCSDLGPHDPAVHNNLGIAFKQLGKLEEAVSSLRQATALKPDLGEAQYNLGNALMDLGSLDEAEVCLRRAISLRGGHAETHERLGVTLYLQGKLAEAEAVTRQSITLTPNQATAHRSLGDTLKALGRFDDAKAAYLQAINLNPDCHEALNNLGIMMFERGDYDEAYRYLASSHSDESRRYAIRCSYQRDSGPDFLKKLDEYIATGSVDPVLGSLIACAKQKYGVEKQNPFCSNPQNYVVHSNLSASMSFKDAFIEPFHEALEDCMQSTRRQVLLTNGIQTSGNIFSHKFFRRAGIEDVVRSEIEKYRARFSENTEGLFKQWPSNYELSGWLIAMKSGGKLSSHMHPDGWVSGSIYVNVPSLSGSEDGKLVLSNFDREGGSTTHYADDRIIDVCTGSMCIFPSSMYHYTIPFESTEKRLVFAFDVIPKS
jgi:Flp pilus assembly protein TadD